MVGRFPHRLFPHAQDSHGGGAVDATLPWTVTAGAARTENRVLALGFAIEGKVERIRVPAPREPSFADGLWQQTCFEAFIAAAGDCAYHEINLAPSRRWAVYDFDDYRNAAASRSERRAPLIEVAGDTGSLRLSANIDLGDLLADRSGGALEIALATVIEDDNGVLSYWALRHDGRLPDFHDRRGFVVRLEARCRA